MKICVVGAGNMGTWFVNALCRDHNLAVYDIERDKLDALPPVEKLSHLKETEKFEPDLLLNAVHLPNIIEAFDAILPYLPEDCLISDIASVKTGLGDYYRGLGKRFVSTHPMFGPTSAKIGDLSGENAILIKESDQKGKDFFRTFYEDLNLSVYEYSFEEHDRTIAYSLSIPFAASMVFAACMKNQEVPGATFRRHLDVAKGLLSEDDHLIAEIMFNPQTLDQIEEINSRLVYLTHIIRGGDFEEMQKFLGKLRNNLICNSLDL